jgi:hypothetical protein
MQTMYITSSSTQKTTRHDKLIAILPLVDKPPFSQNIGHSGKGGIPHRPLLPERLSRNTFSSLCKEMYNITASSKNDLQN